jgi:hypothetical protein
VILHKIQEIFGIEAEYRPLKRIDTLVSKFEPSMQESVIKLLITSSRVIKGVVDKENKRIAKLLLGDTKA